MIWSGIFVVKGIGEIPLTVKNKTEFAIVQCALKLFFLFYYTSEMIKIQEKEILWSKLYFLLTSLHMFVLHPVLFPS